MAIFEDAHISKLRLGNNFVVTDGPFSATFTADSEAANEITVAIQLKDAMGNNLAKSCAVIGYLSANDDGSTFEAHSATLTVAAATDGIVIPMSAANTSGHAAFFAVSEADGDIDLSITQTSGADTFYVVLVMVDGSLSISSAITFA